MNLGMKSLAEFEVFVAALLKFPNLPGYEAIQIN
jgi:hypothetical protein